MTTTYMGIRAGRGECTVLHSDGSPAGKHLPQRHDLANHSPTGFEWGYAGSGPAQLALALLAHATGDDARALRQHQYFKAMVVAGLARERWTLTSDQILSAIAGRP